MGWPGGGSHLRNIKLAMSHLVRSSLYDRTHQGREDDKPIHISQHPMAPRRERKKEQGEEKRASSSKKESLEEGGKLKVVYRAVLSKPAQQKLRGVALSQISAPRIILCG
ncbi:hypothetical protein T310_9265 [Rasamsonia emersonii CBS 393.64]|uniref:Uncharacterized protein n=1 Tax=Rasamsonia emersonii (strain ATCC 16479 / CBS 393.64 / IMI 116815) TaxID=1408163 RepID=A0A0F4YHG1_RASE3|nr:hypothetical protein T310_9265 [Rasamsonia emersonii CBS 393.64]KKA17088.1 hypothetical protein T310_9265 [Rasamsonia emersonii CBS 393.64]